MVAQPALAAVQNYLRALQTQGLPVRFGVVFGSQATGQANQLSEAGGIADLTKVEGF